MFQYDRPAGICMFVTKRAKMLLQTKPGFTRNPGFYKREKQAREFLASFTPNERPADEHTRMDNKQSN